MADDADLQAEIARLQAELAVLQEQLALRALRNVGSTGSVSLGDVVLGDMVLGDKHVWPPAGPSDAVLRREYLGEVIQAASRLTLADSRLTDRPAALLDLSTVFTAIEVADVVSVVSMVGAPLGLEPEPRQRTAIEALAQHDRLVLLGAPGSGKSSVLRFAALWLARGLLGAANWDTQLLPWPHGLLLPLPVALGEFGNWVAASGGRRSGAGLLWSFLDERYGEPLATILRSEAAAGRAVLLLDGLDEVALGRSTATRRRVRECIESLGAGSGASRIVVSCRTLDYTQAQQLPGWAVAALIPLREPLRQLLVGRWFDALLATGTPLGGDPAESRRRLLAALVGRPELQRLAANPLLLTIMVLLQAYEGRLPEERVRLYAQAISFLLHRWRPNDGEQPLRELLDLPGWSEGDVERLLDRLGYVAHELADGTGDEGVDLSRSALIEAARAFFASYDADRDLIRAQAFCTYISSHGNGVLQQVGPHTFRFPHRTFQEYLAARRLVTDDWGADEAEFVDRALRRSLDGPRWREPLVLAVSQLVVVAGQLRPAAGLVEELLDRRPFGSREFVRDAMLAAEALAEIGEHRLRRLGERRVALWSRTAQALAWMLGYLDHKGEPLLPFGERLRAGYALGALGDPRIPQTSESWRGTLLTTGLPDGYWCSVPAGPFLLGSRPSDRDSRPWEQPQQTVELPAFAIGRYPLTNGQWREFVAAGGYRERRWWNEAGWRERLANNWEGAAEPDDFRFNGPNQPVVGVSWHEGQAFCRWLSDLLGRQVALPSEAQWEKAARSSDGRRYPWGGQRAISRANTISSGVGATTPVGCYPNGASPYGALDMAGNVWEWTSNSWRESYHEGNAAPHEPNGSMVIRGGVWASDLSLARCAARDGFDPAGRGTILGLRVALLPPPDEPPA